MDKREESVKRLTGHARVPPNELSAEKCILAATCLQNDLLYSLVETGLQPEDFYQTSHQKIFQVILEMSQKGTPIDLITLSAALRDRNFYEEVGGSVELAGLFDDQFAVANAQYYARIVRDKSILRRIIQVSNCIIEEAFDGVENTEEFLDRAEQEILSVGEKHETSAFSSLSQIMLQTMSQLEELYSKDAETNGLSTGFFEFDRLTTGLRGGQLMIIAARPAMGKTSLFLSMALNVAKDHSKVIAIFSLEMSRDELAFRMLSGFTKIEAKKLKLGKVSQQQYRSLPQSLGDLAQSRIFIDDSGAVTVMDIRSRCRRLLSREKRLDLIVVDYLQLMKGSRAARGENSREREISEISRGLKTLAKELRVPIIALSQLNRGVESRPDKRPMLSDLRESGAIEQDADLVCFIYRDEVYNKDSDDKGIAELIVAKHRAGETGTIRLAWLSQYTLFENLSRDYDRTPFPISRPEKGDIFS